MEGIRLILMDGTVIENGQAGFSEGFLWLYLPGFTFTEAALIAINPAKTGTIIFQYGEMQDEYEGFTTCKTILTEYDRISVCLVKG